MRHLLWRLFFTRTDDVDILQILFLVIVVVTLAVVWRLTGAGATDATVREGLITLRWLCGLLVATAVPKWLVPTIASGVKDRAALMSAAASVRQPAPPHVPFPPIRESEDDGIG